MSDNTPKDFIENLSQKLEPVQVNWSPEARGVLWITFNLSFTFFLMQLIDGFSFAEHLVGWRLFEFALGIISIVILGYCAFLGIVPGASNKNRVRISFFSFVVFLAVFIYAHFASLAPTAPGVYRAHCDIEILALSIFPGLQFAYFLYKDLLFTNKTSFLMAGIVSSLIPAFYMNYICPFHATHSLFFHFGPVIIFAIIYSGIFLSLRKKA